jgi:hypothetical protein
MLQRPDAVSERWWRRDKRLDFTVLVDNRNRFGLHTAESVQMRDSLC